MTANEYQRAALRTASCRNNKSMPEWIRILLESGIWDESQALQINGALGLGGESGEVADEVKKHFFQDRPLDKAHIAKELGDVAWYLAVTAHAIGYDLDTIFRLNIAKLWERYPNGFDSERSINRQETAKEAKESNGQVV